MHGVACGQGQMWVVIVVEWEVGGGSDFMVVMLPGCLAYMDSCVHFTKNEVFLVNESDVLTNRGSGK